jgi:hypothetical protein
MRLASRLRRRWPALDLAIIGRASPGRLPGWIKDWRRVSVDERTERMWCERASASDLVVGVHGSHLLLPSALAGATFELMPEERWGNFLQDLLISTEDPRETLLRYRVLPCAISPNTLAEIIHCHLNDARRFEITMGRGLVRHELQDFMVISKMRRSLTNRPDSSTSDSASPGGGSSGPSAG